MMVSIGLLRFGQLGLNLLQLVFKNRDDTFGSHPDHAGAVQILHFGLCIINVLSLPVLQPKCDLVINFKFFVVSGLASFEFVFLYDFLADRASEAIGRYIMIDVHLVKCIRMQWKQYMWPQYVICGATMSYSRQIEHRTGSRLRYSTFFMYIHSLFLLTRNR